MKVAQLRQALEDRAKGGGGMNMVAKARGRVKSGVGRILAA